MSSNERSGDIYKFFIYLVVVVLINVAAYTLFFRIDLTSNRVYSLSSISREVVSTLSEPLTINVFFTKNLPSPYNNTEKYLRDLLKEYAISANSYFNYRFYDVSSQEGAVDEEIQKNQELAGSFGIQPVQIQALDNDELKFKMAYMGVVILHGDMMEKIPAVTSPDRLEYQLTTAMQRLNNKISAYLRIKEKIKLKLFLSSSLMKVAPLIGIEGISKMEENLEEVISEINRQSYGKLEFINIDPSVDTASEEEVKKYDIVTLEWPDVPEESIESGHGSIGMIAEYGGKTLEIPLLEILRIPIIGTQYSLVDIDVIEEVITETVESLIDINESLGYLADHRSIGLWGRSMNIPGMPNEESLTRFNELASKTYSVKEVRLADRDVLDGLNCLIIAGPKEPFTDYELFLIDQYLMKGKSIAFFMDSFETVQGAGGNTGYQPTETGLDKLLAHYGVNIKKSIVLDKDCYKARLPEEYGGGEQPLYFVPVIKDDKINKKPVFMKDIRGLIVQETSPVIPDENRIKENGLNAYELFSSSNDSWEMNQPINLNPLMIQPPAPYVELKSFPLAYMLEGEFTSYFADKPVPQVDMKEDESEENAEEKTEERTEENKTAPVQEKVRSEDKKTVKGKPGKIFVIGTSGVLKDNVIDRQGTQTNAVFVMNLIDYLNGREEIAVMRGKTGNLNPLKILSAGSRSFIKYFNIVGLPVIVVFFGLFIWFYRHRRKAAIQAMFKK